MADHPYLGYQAGPIVHQLDSPEQAAYDAVPNPPVPQNPPLPAVSQAPGGAEPAQAQASAPSSNTGGSPFPATSMPGSQQSSPVISSHQKGDSIATTARVSQQWSLGGTGAATYGGDQSRVHSGQFVPAPGYMESGGNPNAYGYMQAQGYYAGQQALYPHSPVQSPYPQDPKTEYGPGLTGYMGYPGYASGAVGVAPVVQQTEAQPTYAPPAPSQPGHKLICGIRRSTFWLIFSLALLAFFGALVGGILGGVVFKSKSNPTPTASAGSAGLDPSNSSNPSNPSNPSTKPSRTPTTTTPEPPTPTRSTLSPPTYSFTLTPGTWILNGERALQQGTCIGDTTNDTSVALWKCNQFVKYKVEVSEDPKYGYVLNGDQPTRFRSITPTPPSSGMDYWQFWITYETVPTAAPVQTPCVLNMMMTFLLGKDSKSEKDNYSWVELARAKTACTMKSGMKHESTLTCGCGYFPEGLFKRDELPMSPALELQRREISV